jgi:hypothetical protein
MPPSHDGCGPPEQIMVDVPPPQTRVSHAMRAKLGMAARLSPSAAPETSRIPVTAV